MYGCIGDQMTVQLSSVVFVWKNENKNEIIYSFIILYIQWKLIHVLDEIIYFYDLLSQQLCKVQ